MITRTIPTKTADSPELKRPDVPDIGDPGPRHLQFPEQPVHNLPQGRFYVETSPVFLSGPSRGTPATYNAEVLLRYGLTDRVELRLFTNGPTFESAEHSPSTGWRPSPGISRPTSGRKNEEYHIPAVGLEVFLLTASGSKKINQGTQPSINLLFAHTLPFDIELEWNVGLVGDPSPNNNFSAIEPAAAWAFEREIFKDFFGFLQGYSTVRHCHDSATASNSAAACGGRSTSGSRSGPAITAVSARRRRRPSSTRAVPSLLRANPIHFDGLRAMRSRRFPPRVSTLEWPERVCAESVALVTAACATAPESQSTRVASEQLVAIHETAACLVGLASLPARRDACDGGRRSADRRSRRQVPPASASEASRGAYQTLLRVVDADTA